MHTTMRQFRTRTTKYGLNRRRCADCGRINEPAAVLCYYCSHDSFEDVTLTPEGEVVTVVVQHVLPDAFDTPLPIAIVETPEGGKLLGMFTEVDDPHEIEIGDQVDVELKQFDRTDGQAEYELKFRRAGGASA